MDDFDCSWYHQQYNGKKVLFLVPHEDDEINVGGDLPFYFQKRGAQVFLCFATNGDFLFQARTRLTEALKSAACLGIPEKQVYFLGYGDTSNEDRTSHIYHTGKVTKSHGGHSATYGLPSHPEFIWQQKKFHHSYTVSNYCQDLSLLLWTLQPDMIFCVDYDTHADHRMLSLCFEKEMGKILQTPGNNYHPRVFKGFAYSTAYETVRDFYAPFLSSTQRPEEKALSTTLIGRSIYQWNQRVRFPITRNTATCFLHNNLLFHALCCHRSQAAWHQAEQIINGDKVFWERRTDSFSYQAKITASSNQESSSKLQNFRLYDTRDIGSREPVFTGDCWVPSPDDSKKEILFQWDSSHQLRFLRIFGAMKNPVPIPKLIIRLDDGFTQEIGPLPLQGKPLEIHLPETHKIRRCRIQLHDAPADCGLAECEFFAQAISDTFLAPLLKITYQDNFLYHGMLNPDTSSVQLETYQSFPKRKVYWEILGNAQGARISQTGQLCLSPESRKITVRACDLKHPDIFDQVILIKASHFQFLWLHSRQQAEKKILGFLLKKQRKYYHIRQKYLKNV